MATTATPYGMVPVGLIGGQSFAGSTRKLKIASAYATSIFYGDIVKCVNDGTISKDTGTTTATPIGVFLGVAYTDATLGFVNRQYWPASQVATDAYAFVCDDPDTLFRIQGDGTIAQTSLFNNAGFTQTAGSTVTGNSAVSLTISTIATTATLPIRIVDFVQNSGSSIIGDAYTDVIVKWNFGMHAYERAAGV